MTTRNRDYIFLGLAVSFLIFSIVVVKRQTAALAPKIAPPETEQATATPKPLSDPEMGQLARADKPTRNPFAPPAAAARLKLTMPATPNAPTKPEAPVQVATTPATPPLPAPAATPAVAATNLPPLMVAAPTGKTPGVPVLVGIMNGSSAHPSAVIRDGTHPYNARPGDKIGGRYVVQSVNSQQVVLVSGQSKLILKMGGS
jgi:hypothetical protein